MRHSPALRTPFAIAGLFTMLAGCGGGGGSSGPSNPPIAAPSYTVGGQVTGLASGGTLVLQNNGADAANLGANGAFALAGTFSGGAAYNLTIKTAPPNQSCSIENGSGSVGSTNVTNIFVTCKSLYAYVLNYESVFRQSSGQYETQYSLIQFAVKADGSLAIGSTPKVVIDGVGGTLAIDPAGRNLYVAVGGTNKVSHYAIGENGTLPQVPTSTVSTGMFPVAPLFPQSGKFAYVRYDSSSLARYSVAADGSLTQLENKPHFFFGISNPNAFFADPKGRYLYLIGNNTFFQYRVGETGGLQLTSQSNIDTSLGIIYPTFDPAGRIGYLLDVHKFRISMFGIDADGNYQRSPLMPIIVPDGYTSSICIHPSGKYLYVSQEYSGVRQYSIGGDGALTPLSTAVVKAGHVPSQVVLDPTGRFAYVANSVAGEGAKNPGSISQYTIDAAGGLQPMSAPFVEVPGPSQPTSIVFAYR